MADQGTSLQPVRFETHPDRYRHWHVDFPAEFGGAVARLALSVQEDGGLRSPGEADGYKLKLNSYDLGVDLELADAIQRIRFEHPEVKALEITSGKDRIFCSGANIYMLGSSTHAFKVNFCKFTNETRNAIEDVKSVRGEDIEVSKEGGETVITATWSVKVPMVYNASACLDFVVTTAKQ